MAAAAASRDRLRLAAEDLESSGVTLREAVDLFRSLYVGAALNAAGHNVTRAARRLGVHRNTVHYEISAEGRLRGVPKR